MKPLRNAVIAALLTPTNRMKDKEAARIIQDAFAAGDRTAMARALRSGMLDRPDLTDRFHAIRTPLLIMAGMEDPVWTPQQADLAAVGQPYATVVTIPNAAHLPPLEAPELTTRHIVDFWSEQSA